MKRGFTLIELMAVIVVLGVLATISIISVDKIIKENKEETYKTQIATIEDAARTWGVKHIKELPDNDGGAISVPLLYFKNDGIISNDLKNPKTNKPFNNDLYVDISYESGIYKYKVAEGSGLGTDTNPTLLNRKYNSTLCTAVTTTTVGNVPQGNFAYGDKYVCHLDSDRIFYVLATSGDNVSLIMDRNFIDASVPKLLAWCIDGGDYYKTCENVSSKEENAPLKHIQEVFGADVEVGLPTAKQIAKASGKSFNYIEIKEISTWLYDYLDGTANQVSNIFGYWTASPNPIDNVSAWGITYNGSISSYYVIDWDNLGIRPMITIPKSQLS